uniref:ASXL transcriptional regulator 2 n=1 Tax=Astyanax mexicanus TaxID=7994 RepID=A0A3B1JGF6_ASTMX
MRERQKKKKGRTWAEAAKTVLEKYPNTPMSHKEILQVIQRERLKEISSGTSPLACLNAMLHTNSRGEEGIFYKVPGRMGVYTLKKDIADVVKELSEEASEDSSDNMSDTRSTENNSASSKEGRRGRWKRRGPAKLQSQPSSPQSRCSSPSVSSSKLISSSQKHSKKALKQALKQQQQRNQRRQCGISAASNPRLLLKTVKDMADSASSKSGWELKQSERCPASPQNSTSSSSSSSVKADVCHTAGARKIAQRSSRLSDRQLRRSRCEIDVETPDSILVNTNLRALINKHNFSQLPTDCQQKLLKLLPEIDQQSCMDGVLRVTSSALNNEFFTSAAQSWKERLAEGEFTPELRLRMRQEIEKEKKVEQWKEHFFESYYGEHSGLSIEESRRLTDTESSSAPAEHINRSARSETSTEEQKPRHTVEICHKELRSREVKTAVLVSHSQQESTPKESVAASQMVSNQPLTSQDTNVASSAHEEKSTVAAVKTEPVTSIATNTNVQVSEEKSNTPKPCQEAVSTCSNRKDTLEVKSVKAEGTVPPNSVVTVESMKRKVFSEEEIAEKKPRISPPEGLPPATASSVTVQQRVPPLKIPVSRIVPAPSTAGQVSPRTPLTPHPLTPHPLTPPSIRPGCTGARTLADIKAKAKLAREQRAAAAAAAAGGSKSRGATSGPGSAGGASTPSPARSLSEEFSPASSRSQSVSPVKISSVSPAPESTQSSPFSGATVQTDSLYTQNFSPNQLFLRENRPLMGSQMSRCASNQFFNDHRPVSAGGMQLPPSNALAASQRAQEAFMSGNSMTKSHSLIPANNPLVTQLLQGKDVPLEKILPKPLAKMEVPSVTTSVQGQGNLDIPTKRLGRENLVDTEDISRARLQTSSSLPLTSGRPGIRVDKLDKDTQEQIIHVLRHRSQQRQIPMSVPQPSHLEPYQLGYPDSCNNQPRFHPDHFGRKRVAKPAMTGHYLLNISTYGRGSESSKRPHLANLKRENVEVEEKEGVELRGGPQASSGLSNPPGVKDEQQGYLIMRPDDAGGYQNCPQVKLESPLLGGLSSTGEGCTSTRTKEASLRTHLDVCSGKQGNSGPYQLSDCHPHVTSFQPQKSHDEQEPVLGTFYGGTISMSVPHSLNNSLANTSSSPTVTCSSESANGGMMSFSVTVTAIPAGHLLDQSKGETSPEQAFIEASGMEDVQSKCYCRLKAMIMCKGCGAFCHDDCIGPSKLCVSCLVVR